MSVDLLDLQEKMEPLERLDLRDHGDLLVPEDQVVHKELVVRMPPCFCFIQYQNQFQIKQNIQN